MASTLALTLPTIGQIKPPAGVPSGGLSVTSKIIANSITIMLIVGVILALIFLILGGIQWITSGGDKSKLSSARARITYAIIGLIVAFAAFFIVSVIGFVFKVNLLGVG
ncbi:MAG TPA: hypothetical protein VLF93_03540 [Candidatus Saccharimonadales bacterium]|nr:hypothetical protein [Candidatus Saccharimonadales bacterium]